MQEVKKVLNEEKIIKNVQNSKELQIEELEPFDLALLQGCQDPSPI